jgi:hypothetical protein
MFIVAFSENELCVVMYSDAISDARPKCSKHSLMELEWGCAWIFYAHFGDILHNR